MTDRAGRIVVEVAPGCEMDLVELCKVADLGLEDALHDIAIAAGPDKAAAAVDGYLVTLGIREEVK